MGLISSCILFHGVGRFVLNLQVGSDELNSVVSHPIAASATGSSCMDTVHKQIQLGSQAWTAFEKTVAFSFKRIINFKDYIFLIANRLFSQSHFHLGSWDDDFLHPNNFLLGVLESSHVTTTAVGKTSWTLLLHSKWRTMRPRSQG